MATHPGKKLVLLTYEFTYSPFSGNGILARSIVKSLLSLGCSFTVWCCRPEERETDDSCKPHAIDNQVGKHNHLAVPEISEESYRRLRLVTSVIPARLGWRKLDDRSGWDHFRTENMNEQDRQVLEKAVYEADAICVIDWTGAVAYRSIHLAQQRPNVFYLNFRVYSSGVSDPERKEWFDRMERDALSAANTIVALSTTDAQTLSSLRNTEGMPLQQGNMSQLTQPKIEIVLPPLRQDMADLASAQNWNGADSLPTEVVHCCKGLSRTLVACVVRQSPEKEVMRFVNFVRQATAQLNDYGFSVVLAGAGADSDYAEEVRSSLRSVFPSAVIIDSFLKPEALGALFLRTAVNIHPCSYDAYGMTVVEAAAFGAPSVLAPGVGASALIGPNESIRVQFPSTNKEGFSEADTDKVVRVMSDPRTLCSVSEAAKRKALGWSETAYGRELLRLIEEL